MSRQEEIEVRLVLPIPGKWTIETTEEGEFILTNETNTSATAYLDIDKVKEALNAT